MTVKCVFAMEGGVVVIAAAGSGQPQKFPTSSPLGLKICSTLLACCVPLPQPEVIYRIGVVSTGSGCAPTSYSH
jgi:hypothetical protein